MRATAVLLLQFFVVAFAFGVVALIFMRVLRGDFARL